MASTIREKLAGLLAGPAALGQVNQVVGPTGPKIRSEFMRGGRGITFKGWRPALRETQTDVAVAWDDAAARLTDLAQNSGWIAGAIEQACANTVGDGLRLAPKPENEVFGMSDADARAWSRKVSQRFGLWAGNAVECDIERRRTFGQMQEAALRSYFATGEVLAELPWRKLSYTRYGTKVRILPPWRLSRKSNSLERLVNGVYHNADGAPVGYLAKREDRFTGLKEWKVRARDGAGRLRVVHVFEGMPGTCRGISPLVPALQVAKQFDQLADATLTAAIVQTLFAVTIESDAPTEESMAGLLTASEMARIQSQGGTAVEEYLQMAGAFYDNSTIDVGTNGRVAHLFPGEKMEFHTPGNPHANYPDFAAHLLRELARCLGLTYESATGDWTDATYSSTRMATAEIFHVTKKRRKNIVVPFCQAAYEAWLEEEIEAGTIEFPGGWENFMANRSAACRADWLGSPRPQADDLKTAKAHEIYYRLGTTTGEAIAQDIGQDYEDVCQQLAAEAEMRKRYGIEEPQHVGAQGGGPKSKDDDDPDKQIEAEIEADMNADG